VPGRAQRNRGRTIAQRQHRVPRKQPKKRQRRKGAGAPPCGWAAGGVAHPRARLQTPDG
jgi:hypothetical protein